MIITLFNGLSGLQVRGISKMADELARHLRMRGHSVVEVKIPPKLYVNNIVGRVMVVIFFQQLVCPLVAVINRAQMIIDPYNGYPLLGSLIIRTKYFIHDYTPFKRSLWFLRPGTICQLILFKLDSAFGLAEVYHDADEIDTPKFLRRRTRPRIFPCIVDPLDDSPSDFYDTEIHGKSHSSEAQLLISTISGAGWNKDFSGLRENIFSLRHSVALVAFGFGEEPIKRETAKVNDGRTTCITTVGHVSESAIADVMRRSKLFVFHSVNEGFGRPIIEALLMQIIVVTIRAPVVGLLSEQALRNVFVYKNEAEFIEKFELALGGSFEPFEKLYRDAVDQDIEVFIA